LPRPPPSDFCFLPSQFQLFSPPARALAAETSTLERTLSDLVSQAYGLAPAQIDLVWLTALPRMPIPVPGSPEQDKG
jgi:diketogulonate reductase-like aldo/keto reductase